MNKFITRLIALFKNRVCVKRDNAPKCSTDSKNEYNYRIGNSIDIGSPQELVTHLEMLANQGEYAAYFDLGQLYLQGNRCVQRDIHRAISYFNKAADNNIVEAAYQLGTIYETGFGPELPANQVLSYEWYARAAKGGIPEAENNLGSCYFFGRGVEVNFEKAFLLYKSSAEKGNAEGEMNVGICYAAGRGVLQDYTLAYTWWKKAAEHGHIKAMVNLATCYEMGAGVAQNITEAYKWYEKAAKLGDVIAANKLASLDTKLIILPWNKKD